jgi:hypothetical protein
VQKCEKPLGSPSFPIQPGDFAIPLRPEKNHGHANENNPYSATVVPACLKYEDTKEREERE